MIAFRVMKKLIPILTFATLIGLANQSNAQGHPQRPDWDSLKKRIEGAVERGDLTRDQANQKYLEIKKKAAAAQPKAPSDRPAPHPHHPMPGADSADPLGRVLGTLIREGKINAMDAARIRRAASIAPPRPPTPQIHDRQPPRPPEHLKNQMHELLKAAQNELAQIREIRMQLQKSRQSHEAEVTERREHEMKREAVDRERERPARPIPPMRERAAREAQKPEPRREQEN